VANGLSKRCNLRKSFTEFEAPHRLRAFVRARETGVILLAAIAGALAGLVVAAMGSAVELLHSLFFDLRLGQRLSAHSRSRSPTISSPAGGRPARSTPSRPMRCTVAGCRSWAA
jgi:hypothetical protein